MYKNHPKEGFMSKTLRTIDQGLKIYGTGRGLYEAVSATAGALRSAYQIAAPAIAML